MPSATPLPTAPVSTPVVARPVPTWPPFAPQYPKAGPVGMLVVALAYFSLGVAVGALLKDAPGRRRWLRILVVPGAVAAIAFFAWVVRTLL